MIGIVLKSQPFLGLKLEVTFLNDSGNPDAPNGMGTFTYMKGEKWPHFHKGKWPQANIPVPCLLMKPLLRRRT